MKRLFKRLFGDLKMSWPAVVLFAAAAGIYTGGILLVTPLKGTSFQDIGISFEWWVIFAVIVVVNCRKNLEAMLKCFAFFLISQPLVYAVQILFGPLSPSQALYYYRSMWLPATLLTLPGGFIAFWCRKQNAAGAVVLGLGNTIQMFLGVSYFVSAVQHFPYHLLSALVCFGSAVLMSFRIQKEKKYRLLSLLIPAVLTAGLVVFCLLSGRTLAFGG